MVRKDDIMTSKCLTHAFEYFSGHIAPIVWMMVAVAAATYARGIVKAHLKEKECVRKEKRKLADKARKGGAKKKDS